jgi:hypothetical protein
MNASRRVLPQRLVDELDGLDWEVTNGSRHLKLRVGGKLIAVYPRGHVPDGPRSHKLRNIIKKLRKSLAQ